MPKIVVNGTLYMIAGINNSNTMAIESVPLQTLYTKGNNNSSTLCNTSIITPSYITTIATDLTSSGIMPIYAANGNIYTVYYSTSGYVKLLTFNTATNGVSVKQLLQVPNNILGFAIVNGNVYVSSVQGNTLTVYKFDLNGNSITSQSYPGIGFVDMNGYVIQFTNGLNSGSTINVYQPL